MLVHICCSVDAHFFLQKIQKDFPKEKLIGFFYNPNIHPYSEYRLRLLEVKRSCKKLNIELIEGEYEYESWIKETNGLEKEREKQKRCKVCFEERLLKSAKKAVELGETTMTTTLLISPLKSQEALKKTGDRLFKEYGVSFIAVDYRSNGGTQQQSYLAKKEQLYRQDYCGCLYALTMQRKEQNKTADELFSPLSKTVMPASIQERLELYSLRKRVEKKGIPYKIIKQKFLNYRQFSCKLLTQKENNIDAYALCYSTLPRKKAHGYIEYNIKEIYYMNREEVKFITLDFLNTFFKTEYKKIQELIFNPPSIKEELKLRETLCDFPYDLTPIIVVEKIPDTKLKLFLDAKIYEDIREKLIIL